MRTRCALGDRLGCAPCVPALGESSGLLEHSTGGATYCKGRQADASTEGALRRESPQRNPVSSSVKMRQQFKPSKATQIQVSSAQATPRTYLTLLSLPPGWPTSPAESGSESPALAGPHLQGCCLTESPGDFFFNCFIEMPFTHHKLHVNCTIQ